MLRRAMCSLLLALAALPALGVDNAEPAVLHVIAYHDVRDVVAVDVDDDQYAISTANLISHFQWLRVHGFVPVSIEQIVRARAGTERLPDNAVLLTFDDGFKSTYTHVLPLLELFDYPAVAAVVTGWVEGEPGVAQAGRVLTRADFMSWDDIRELERSGLVEIASHSHDFHRGVVGNPQGNEQPAAVTRAWGQGRYEDEHEYRARVARDLAASARLIAEQTGRAPRVVAWPYGASNAELGDTARDLGMSVALTLAEGRNDLVAGGEHLTLGRHLIRGNPGVEALATALLHAPARLVVRAAQVDLDYVYDEDPAQQEANLGLLLDRIKALGISHVFLQAFADPDADGGAQQLYFPNRHLPVRADLFNRAAWQLKTRANVLVYAWLPLLSFEGAAIDASWRVLADEGGVTGPDARSEPRLSPFEPRARAVIRDIYVDLAAHASFDGLLFHDDGRLSDVEDANPAALAAARAALGPEFSIERARSDTALAERWAVMKSAALIDLSNELTAAVRELRPEIHTARNLFASALLDPAGQRYLAQELGSYLAAYDHVALMAMPYLEAARDPREFYRSLVRVVVDTPHGLDKTIFELQTVDWRTGTRIDAHELETTLRSLQAQGVRHLAYYPDDFVEGEPALAPLRRGISLATHPAEAPR
jgi:poly-beta-1,6-N-acetyl-D-glucosamine N-deacetylase